MTANKSFEKSLKISYCEAYIAKWTTKGLKGEIKI